MRIDTLSTVPFTEGLFLLDNCCLKNSMPEIADYAILLK